MEVFGSLKELEQVFKSAIFVDAGRPEDSRMLLDEGFCLEAKG